MSKSIQPAVRSRMMAAVKGKNTSPEMAVRKGIHALGFRYVLHSQWLSGKPDIVLPKYRAAIFVNGCFWHGHGCLECRPARSRKEFWEPKIASNKARDERSLSTLQAAGWRTLVIWECALKDAADTIGMTARWLHAGDRFGEISYSSGSPASTVSSGATRGTASPAK